MSLKLNVKPNSKANKPKVFGPAGMDKLAGVYRDLAREMDEIKARMEMAREEMLAGVDEHRQELLKSGIPEGTITLPTPDGGKVLVIYQERYKSLTSDNVPELQRAFGSNYRLFAEETEAVTLAKHATVEKLKQACGDSYEKVAELLEITTGVQPRKGAWEHIAMAYRQGNVELAEDLSAFVAGCVTGPQVRT